MAKAESSVSMSLKLLVDTDARRVLFAEVGKDFVDFLFLSLPFASVINLIKTPEMAGSLSNLYRSVENLNESYMQSSKTKDALLNPVSLVSGSVPLVMHPSAAKMFYMVMDDLVVTPSSTISSSIAVLNKLGVKDFGSLEVKVVYFGIDEALKLLDAFLVSKKVLTEVFLTRA